MAQRNLKWYSVHTNVVALREMAQRSVEWYSVHTNGVALREMAQRNVEWCSVHANSVALREMGRRNVEWYSVHTSLQNIRHSGWTLNWLALLEIFRIVELACGVTWRLSRRNHQKYKPQMEQRSAGGHDVIECEDCRETITCCSCCIEESSLRLAVKQSQFGKFLLFSFPCRYCIYSLSFMKALIKHMVFAKATFLLELLLSPYHGVQGTQKSNFSPTPAMFKESLKLNSHWKISVSPKKKIELDNRHLIHVITLLNTINIFRLTNACKLR